MWRRSGGRPPVILAWRGGFYLCTPGSIHSCETAFWFFGSTFHLSNLLGYVTKHLMRWHHLSWKLVQNKHQEVKLGFQSSPQQNRKKHQSDLELRERLRLFVFCLIGLYQCPKLLERVGTISWTFEVLAAFSRYDFHTLKMTKTRPDQTQPDQTRPNQTRPDQTGLDQTRPDQTRQDQTKVWKCERVEVWKSESVKEGKIER